MAGTAFSTANWTGYDEQSVTNPGSALTDFTLLIDVSTLSSDWKSNVQSDGADIRLTKGDDTELPYDLIDWAYNAGAPTGWIRVKWSGTLAASGTQNVRVWAGYTGGTATAYTASETYGQYNAYDANWEAYWVFEEDPSGSAPQILDRTSNGRNLTTEGTMVSGDLTTGQVGSGVDFDGADDIASITGLSINLASSFLVMAWSQYAGSGDGGHHLFDLRGTGSEVIAARAANGDAFFRTSGGTTPTGGQPTLAYSNGSWKHYAARADGTNAITYGNSTQEDSAAWGGSLTAVDEVYVGGSSTSTNEYGGIIDEVQIHSDGRSAAWISEEYAQSNDQATFWGTWAWTAVGGGGVTGTASLVNSGLVNQPALVNGGLVA